MGEKHRQKSSFRSALETAVVGVWTDRRSLYFFLLLKIWLDLEVWVFGARRRQLTGMKTEGILVDALERNWKKEFLSDRDIKFTTVIFESDRHYQND